MRKGYVAAEAGNLTLRLYTVYSLHRAKAADAARLIFFATATASSCLCLLLDLHLHRHPSAVICCC
jgi:hypothetical protein